MWNVSRLNECLENWNGNEYCFSFKNCRGWGCRFLTIIPDAIPKSEHERAKLFSKVYRQAELLGVTACKKFVPTRIDEVVDNPTEVANIMLQKE